MTEEERKDAVYSLKLNLLYSLAEGLEQLVYDCENLTEARKSNFFHERKQHIKNCLKCLKDAHTWFTKAFENDVLKIYHEDWKQYDILRYQGNEQMRFALIAADRTRDNNENYEKLYQFLLDMEGGMNVLKDEDIARYDFKL